MYADIFVFETLELSGRQRGTKKQLPVTEGQHITAKVPGCAKRSTCTLSTLINLQAEVYAAA